MHGKLKDRPWVGLYLGHSPLHAQSVALVLNLKTGLISPQFHVTFDPSFQTVKRTFKGLTLEIKWSEATGFRAKSKSCSSTQREESPSFPLPNSVSDLQFSTIDDSESDFQDLPPIQEGTNLQGPSPDSEGASQGWFDFKTVPTMSTTSTQHSAGTVHSDDKGASASDTSDHSSTAMRQSNQTRHPVEKLAFAVTLLCTCASSTPTKWETPNEIFSTPFWTKKLPIEGHWDG